MLTCQPDHRGRVNLGKLVSQGDTWGIVVATEDRIELVKMKPHRRKRKESLVDLCQQLGKLGFKMPEKDYASVATDSLP